jgi:hypothetical protein
MLTGGLGTEEKNGKLGSMTAEFVTKRHQTIRQNET